MPKPLLSALVIGCDQALTLDACLESLRGVQIFYGDGGSTDNSVDIALGHDAIIVDCKGMPGGLARNFMAKHCKSEYIIWLSPDDVLEPGGIDCIKTNLRRSRARALNVQIHEIDGTHWFWFPRIFKPSEKWYGRCHETLEEEVHDNTPVAITHMRGPWHDKPTDPRGIIKLLEMDLQDEPNNPRALYYLGRELFNAKEWAAAAGVFEQRVQVNGFLQETADAWMFLARCYGALNMTWESGLAAMGALAVNSNFGEAARFLSEIAALENRDQWAAMADRATNERVLVVRK